MGYKKQIIDHNVEKFCLIIKADIDMFSSVKTLTQAYRDVELQVNFVNGRKKIREDLRWQFRKNECRKL